MTRPAVLYARQSPRPAKPKRTSRKKPRVDAVDDSCDAQLGFCRRFAATYEYEVIGEFADRLRSGSDYKKRPEFRRAMKLAAARKAVLIVYSQSRFARNTEHACKMLRYLLKNGAALASVKECIDTSTSWGRAMFKMKAVWDELEREQTSERTSDSMLSYQADGRRMGGSAPYGMTADPQDSDRWIEDPAEQQGLTRLLELAASPAFQTRDGKPKLRPIARQLEVEGHPTRNGHWHPQTVKRILHRQATTVR